MSECDRRGGRKNVGTGTGRKVEDRSEALAGPFVGRYHHRADIVVAASFHEISASSELTCLILETLETCFSGI